MFHFIRKVVSNQIFDVEKSKNKINIVKNFLVILAFVFSKVQNVLVNFSNKKLCFEFYKLNFILLVKVGPQWKFSSVWQKIGEAREGKEMRGERGKMGREIKETFLSSVYFARGKWKKHSLLVCPTLWSLSSLPLSSQF